MNVNFDYKSHSAVRHYTSVPPLDKTENRWQFNCTRLYRIKLSRLFIIRDLLLTYEMQRTALYDVNYYLPKILNEIHYRSTARKKLNNRKVCIKVI